MPTKEHGATIARLVELEKMAEAELLALESVPNHQQAFLDDLAATGIPSLQHLAKNEGFKKKVLDHFTKRQKDRARLPVPPPPPASPDVSPLIVRLIEAGARNAAQDLADAEVPKLTKELVERLRSAGVPTEVLSSDLEERLTEQFANKFATLIAPKEKEQPRQDVGSLIGRLMDVGETAAAQHLAQVDTNRLTIDFLDRLTKAGVPQETLSAKVKGNVEQFFANKYAAITKPPPEQPVRPDVNGLAKKLVELNQIAEARDLAERHVERDADEIVRELELAGVPHADALRDKLVGQLRSANSDLIRKAMPRDLETEQRELRAHCVEIATSILAAVDDAYAAIVKFCSKFRVDRDNGNVFVDTEPFSTQYQVFQAAAGVYEAANLIDPEVIKADVFGYAVISRVIESPALVVTAVGDIIQAGGVRPAVVRVDPATPERAAGTGFGEPRVIDHAIFGFISKAALDKTSMRRLATWLRHHNVDPIPEGPNEFGSFPQWTGIAAVWRTALLLVEQWQSQLQMSRNQLILPTELITDQNEAKEGAAKIDADSVIKTITPLCKAELNKVIERQAAALAQDMLAARVRVEAIIKRVDPFASFEFVPADDDPRDKGIDRFKLAESVRTDIMTEIVATSRNHQAEFAKVVEAAWNKYVVPTIVLHETAKATDEFDLKKLLEATKAGVELDLKQLPPFLRMVGETRLGHPLPKRVSDAVLAKQTGPMEERGKTGEFELRLPKISPKGLWDQAMKVPSRIMQLFGPIAIVLVFVGTGSLAGIFKGFFGAQAEQNFWGVFLGLLTAFFVIGWFIFVQQISRDRLIQVANMRGRILELFDRTSAQVQRNLIEAARTGADRVLNDYLRHIREFIAAGVTDRHGRQREKMRILQQQKDLLEATAAGLDDALGTLKVAAKTIGAERKKVRNLAEKHIFSDRRGGE